jgi:carboxyl-terminal processing protease
MLRKYLLIGASAFVLGAGSMAYVGAQADAKTSAPSRQHYRMLELFGDVMDIAEDKYVTKVDEEKLVTAAIEGMLASLDPHSSYLSPEGFDDMRDVTRGAYGGLGLEVSQEEGAVKVISPMDDTPASRAGVQSGDFIIAIDGQSIVGLPLSEAVKKMKGEPGAEIALTIVREKVEPFDVKLKREIIKPKAAIARAEGDVGYLRLGSGFNEKTTDEARAAIQKLMRENPKMKGLVLDLRNNPGGLLDQAVSVSDLFLDGGEVVSQRGREPDDIERYNAKPGDILNGLPMVVLINSGSASAAEIVAGALKDRRRAEVVGLTSYGKGSVQTVIPLRGGIDGALKLTTGRYYTPSGQSIQKTGIEPDLEVAASREQAELLANRAYQPSEATQPNALNADEGKTRRGVHEVAEAPPVDFEAACKDLNPTQRLNAGAKCDFQLTRAIAVLNYGSVAKTPKVPGMPRLAAAGSRFASIKPPSTAVDPKSAPEKPTAR